MHKEQVEVLCRDVTIYTGNICCQKFRFGNTGEHSPEGRFLDAVVQRQQSVDNGTKPDVDLPKHLQQAGGCWAPRGDKIKQ